jgi:hypothetical protein
METTRAGAHRRHQHEARGKGERSGGSGNRHVAVLERLAILNTLGIFPFIRPATCYDSGSCEQRKSYGLSIFECR